jgi:hypothetical protein
MSLVEEEESSRRRSGSIRKELRMACPGLTPRGAAQGLNCQYSLVGAAVMQGDHCFPRENWRKQRFSIRVVGAKKNSQK